jgi:hypothetical protein
MARKTNADDPFATKPPEGLSGVGGTDAQSDPLSSGASSGLGSTGSRGSSQSGGGTGSASSGGDGGIVDSAKQTAGQMVDSAKNTAGQVVDKVKDQATSRADEQRQTVASGFEAVAHAFRGMGDGLRNQDQGPVAQYAAELGHAAAGQVDRLANYLRGRDVRQIVNDTEDLARRSPGMFLGGAFAIGFVASRFLKSSRPAPDLFANMPDPNRALPPASTSSIRTGGSSTGGASSAGGSSRSYGASAGTSGPPTGMPGTGSPGAGSPGWSGTTPSTGSGAGTGAGRSWPGSDVEPTGGA